MDIIRVEDLVKLKIDADGNSQKCLGLKKDNRTGLVTKISRDPGFVQVENNQASSPSIYRRDHLLHADAPPPAPAHAAAAPASPTSILKTNLDRVLIELDTTIAKCERMSGLLSKAREIQRIINARAANPVAIKKTLLIDSVTAILDVKLKALNEYKNTGNGLKVKYNTRAVFGDLAMSSYSSLIDTIRQNIAEVNRFIQSVKTNGEESRYLPGIITEIVAGGKRSDTKRSSTKRSSTKRRTLRRNRKNRRTLKANARR